MTLALSEGPYHYRNTAAWLDTFMREKGFAIKCLEAAAIVVLGGALLLKGASMIGLIGFHYPHIIENEPLQNPQKVVRIDGTNLFLECGAVVALNPFDATDISGRLKQSGFEIDLKENKSGELLIFARQDGWVCGTPWAHPIRIPLIPDATYKNRREMIAFGFLMETGSVGGSRTNGHMQARSKTNQITVPSGPTP